MKKHAEMALTLAYDSTSFEDSTNRVVTWNENLSDNIPDTIELVDKYAEQVRNDVCSHLRHFRNFLYHTLEQFNYHRGSLWDKAINLSQFCEKNNIAQESELNWLVRLTAVKLYAEKNKCTSIRVVGFPNDLEFFIFGYLGKRIETNLSFRKRYALPVSLFCKALLFQVCVFFQSLLWRPRKMGLLTQASIVFFDYFYQLNIPFKKDLNFSKAWATLPNSLAGDGKNMVLWVHRYVRCGQTPTLRDARKLVSKLNSICISKGQMHVLIEDELSFSHILKGCFLYFKILQTSIKVRSLAGTKGAEFQHLLSSEMWCRSFISSQLVLNLCIDEVISDVSQRTIRPSTTTCYVLENQPWEWSLNHSAKKMGAHRVVGVIQGMVRFWDLRFAEVFRQFKYLPDSKQCLPSRIATNSRDATFKLKDKSPTGSLVPVEAYRLNECPINIAMSDHRITILVVGDFSLERTETLLRATLKATESLNFDFRLCLRPHPGTNPKEINKLLVKTGVEVQDGAIGPRSIIVAETNSTLGVQTHIVNIPTVFYRMPNSLNFSPLYMSPSAIFVGSIFELGRSIEKILSSGFDIEKLEEEFFYASLGKESWLQLLMEDWK